MATPTTEQVQAAWDKYLTTTQGGVAKQPVTTTQTFDPKYISGYDDLISNTANANLANNLAKYGTVTDTYGNPIFDQNTLSSYYSDQSALDKSTKAISSVAGKTIQTGLATWADEVLQKDTIDPVTGNPVNWVGGFGGAQYKAARTALIADPSNNARWTTQSQTIADEAVATANTATELKTATELQTKADAEAKTQSAIATTLATDKDAASQLAQQAANDLKLKNATAPIDAKTLGGGFDVNGNPIASTATSGITQDVINKGLLNVSKIDAPTAIVNPNSAADVTRMVDAAKSSDVNVTPGSMVSNQLSGLLAKNNPYIQQAVNSANLQASRRGMLNTGAAAGFAQDAAIKAALPIAQGDAQTIAKANEANAQAQNALLNTGLGLKATSMDRQAQNNIQVQNWNAANKITVDSSNAKAINDATALFTTAILNDMNNLATANRDNSFKLNQLIASGNIEIAGKVTQSVIDSLAAEKSANSALKLASFQETLKQQTNQMTAENQKTLDSLKNDQSSYDTAVTANATVDAKLLDELGALARLADMGAPAKATNANNLTLIATAMKNNNLKTALARSQLTNSSAGQTVTALVSP